MLKRHIIKLTVRNNQQRKQAVQEHINATIIRKGVTISHAKTIKEICDLPNYHQSVHISVCGKGKL